MQTGGLEGSAKNSRPSDSQFSPIPLEIMRASCGEELLMKGGRELNVFV